MRPKKLVMQAFGSYGKRTEIDFTKSKQNLFLITGNTGSGKTTIFDAIVFALFGEASSGYNKKSGEELQSQFVDYGNEPFVEFTFTEKTGSTDEEYKIKRIPKHIRPYKKGKEGYKDEQEKVSLFYPDNSEYSQKVKETNDKIKEIIKLTKAQFMQVSMIAQGEFMEVLRGNDKQTIYRKLFNTEIYRELIQNLKSRSENKKDELKELTSNCKMFIGGIRVPECMAKNYIFPELKKETDITDIENANDKLSILCKELYDLMKTKQVEDDKLLAERDEKKEELMEGNHLLEYFETLYRAENEIKELEDKKQEMEKLTKLVKDIEIAYDLENFYKNFIEAEKNLINAEKELILKKDELPKLITDYEESCKKEKLAEKELNICRDSFNKVSEKVKKALKDFSDIEKAENEKIIREKEKVEAARSLEKASRELKEFEACEKAWNEAVKKLPNFKIELNKVNDKAVKCENTNVELKNLINIREELILGKEDIQIKEKICKDEIEKLKLADIELADKRALFYEMRAGLLAKNRLKEGEPCPVCGSRLHPNPCKLTKEQEEITKEMIENLEKKAAKINDSVKLKSSELEGCKKRFEEKAGNFQKNKEKLINAINKELFELNCLNENNEGIVLENISYEIKLFSKENKKILARLEENIKKLELVEKNLSTAEEQKTILKQFEVNAKEKEIKIDKEISKLESVIKTLMAGLDYETKEKAVSAEKTLETEKLKAETVYREIKKKSETAKSLKERNEILIKQLEINCPQLKKIKETKEYEYINAMSYENISEEEWKNVVKEHKKLEKDEFRSIINKYISDKRVANSKAVEMREKIKGREKPDISLLQAEFEKFREMYKSLHAEFEEITAYYKIDKDILERLNLALEGRETAANEYRIISGLSNKLSGKVSGARMDIETFVQRRYLEKILVSANKRFRDMSAGQLELRTYELEKAGEGKNRGLDLMAYSAVTGKCRDVRTLSGGESFMAALALALGMADRIQEKSGAVNLEMMFVDEGFGTLDDNSRKQAVNILKNMAGGSKLIGIISHVSELRDEIDEKLEVTKNESGSQAKWRIS
nr:AAA family ATPase [uncultured Catonella sp.]